MSEAPAQLRVDGRIVVTSVEMVTSLGPDWVSSCAAARAGIVRGSEIEDYVVQSSATKEKTLAIGHPVLNVTRGFEGTARLVALARAPIARFLERAGLKGVSPGRVAVRLALPDPRRRFRGGVLTGNPERQEEWQAELSNWAKPEPHELVFRQLSGEGGIPAEAWSAEYGDRCGVLRAVRKACDELLQGRVDAVVVGGVDSLLDEATLVWLEATHRLRSVNIGAGLAPAEAAVYVLLERAEDATRRGARPLASIGAVASAAEENDQLSGKPVLARGTARLLELLAPATKPGRAPWVISDQNGELYRAREWGTALHLVLPVHPEFDAVRLDTPAEYFADTGAAQGGVLLGVATRAFDRGYALAETAMLLTSSDGPEREGIVLAGP